MDALHPVSSAAMLQVPLQLTSCLSGPLLQVWEARLRGVGGFCSQKRTVPDATVAALPEGKKVKDGLLTLRMQWVLSGQAGIGSNGCSLRAVDQVEQCSDADPYCVPKNAMHRHHPYLCG